MSAVATGGSTLGVVVAGAIAAVFSSAALAPANPGFNLGASDNRFGTAFVQSVNASGASTFAGSVVIDNNTMQFGTATGGHPTLTGLSLRGALLLSSSSGTNDPKAATYLGRHYDNGGVFVLVTAGWSDASTSIGYWGGGWAAHRAMTQLEYYTAANTTTLVGTLRGSVNSAGLWRHLFNFQVDGTSTFTGAMAIAGATAASSTVPMAIGPGAANDLTTNPGGASNRHALVASTTPGQSVSWNLSIADGTRNPRCKFFLHDNVTAENRAWGHWYSASSGIAPYVIGIASTEVMRITSAGDVGFGGAPITSARLYVQGTQGILVSHVATDATQKQGRIGIRHYTNSELPFYGFMGDSSVAQNILRIGGGTSIGNAATSIEVYSAANNTTPTGTLRGTVTSSGLFDWVGALTVGGTLRHNGGQIGFYNTTPIARPSDPGGLTDSTGGTAGGTLSAVSGSGADTAINDNFASLAAKVNALRAVLSAAAGGVGLAA